MKFYFSQSPVRVAVLAVLGYGAVAMLHSPHAHAQVNAGALAPTLKEVTVTGNPLGSSDLVAPTSALAGTALLLKRESTLGETLANTPTLAPTPAGRSFADRTATVFASCKTAAPALTHRA